MNKALGLASVLIIAGFVLAVAAVGVLAENHVRKLRG